MSTTISRQQLIPTMRMVVPLLALIVIGFNLPLIVILGRSVISEAGLSVASYVSLVESSAYARVLANTLKIAAATTILCVLLGYPLTYWLWKLRPRWQAAGVAVVVLSLWISVLVRSYAWTVILGNAGILNKLLITLGWIAEPLEILYNQLGVLIGTTNILLPFLVLPLFATMKKIDVRLLKAARTLGASDRTVFWRIFFPLTIPALAAESVLIFILALGFYVTPAVLGGGRVPMIATLLDILINQMPNWQVAASISSVILIVTLLLFALYLKFNEKTN